ncbi:MAG: hypothetical protein AAB903_03275, partial [Patescibacteria group bacterium]
MIISFIKKTIFQKMGIGALLFSTILFPQTLFAATFFFEDSQKKIRSGDQFSINVKLDTEEDVLNALQGGLVLSPELKPIQIRDGQSVVTIWSERPQVVPGGGNLISFSGIMPGGYSGSDGLVFSLDLEAMREGKATVFLRDVVALKNDGLGSDASVVSKPLIIFIEQKIGSSTTNIGLKYQFDENFLLLEIPLNPMQKKIAKIPLSKIDYCKIPNGAEYISLMQSYKSQYTVGLSQMKGLMDFAKDKISYPQYYMNTINPSNAIYLKGRDFAYLISVLNKEYFVDEVQRR